MRGCALTDRLRDMGADDALMVTGYDDCVIGVLERCGMEPIILYDKEKVLRQLMDEWCDSYEEALEYLEFNRLCGWHGPKTPGFLVRLP